jgi:hypothetical protein
MDEVSLDQSRVADHAMADCVGFQSAIGAHEEPRAEGGFDLVQGFAGARLGQRQLFRRAKQRPVFPERDQKTQLLYVQTGNNRVERRGHRT